MIQTSEKLRKRSEYYLLRTLIKIPLWFGIAWLINYFFPGSTWAWTVAWVFVGISMAVSLFLLGLAFLNKTKGN